MQKYEIFPNNTVCADISALLIIFAIINDSLCMTIQNTSAVRLL